MVSIDKSINRWITDSGAGCISVTSSLSINTDGFRYADSVAVFLGFDTSTTTKNHSDIFSNPRNLPTAITTILTYAQSMAYYHPLSQSPNFLAERLTSYLIGVDKIPFFKIVKDDYSKIKVKPYCNDKHSFINNIMSFIDVKNDIENAKLKRGVTAITENAFNRHINGSWDNVLSISIIDLLRPLEPKISIYYISIRIQRNRINKNATLESSYIINRVEYMVSPELIRTHAETLSNLVIVDVDEWINESSSCLNNRVYTT